MKLSRLIANVITWCLPTLGMSHGSITTTLYVSHQFEIREHQQPTKYVFNGSTKVAKITGSLSANQRLQRLRVYAGWNLCSIAVAGPFPAGNASALSAAYQWNASTGGYSRIAFGQVLPAGTVLWLNAKTNAIVSVRGTYINPVTRQLPAGGMYVSGAGLESWTPVLPASDSFWIFDAPTDQWLERLGGALAEPSQTPSTLAPGDACYIQVPASLTLDGPDPTLSIRYYHPDHIGSSSILADAAGQIIEESAFYPFGAARNTFQPRGIQEPYQFTQKERDRESGVDYFGARYFQAGIAKWMSCDPAAANDANPYLYAKNNPLRFVDPQGLDDWDPDQLRAAGRMIGCDSPSFNLENIRNQPAGVALNRLCNAAAQDSTPSSGWSAADYTGSASAGFGDAFLGDWGILPQVGGLVFTGHLPPSPGHVLRSIAGGSGVAHEGSGTYIGGNFVGSIALVFLTGRVGGVEPSAPPGPRNIENSTALAKTPAANASPEALASTAPGPGAVTGDTPGISAARESAALSAARNAQIDAFHAVLAEQQQALRAARTIMIHESTAVRMAFDAAEEITGFKP